MCVATPGRILEIAGNTAKVDFLGNLLNVNVSLVDVSVGDWVLTHAGMAIEKLDPDHAVELARLLEEIGELANEGN